MNIVDTAGTYFGARIGPKARKHIADRPEIGIG